MTVVKKGMAVAAAALLAGALAACDPAPKGTPLANSSLKPALKTGDTHRIRMIREELLEQGNPGIRERLSRHLGVDCTFHVFQVEPDGTAHIRMTLDRGQYKQGGDLADADELPPIFKKYSGVENPLAHIKGRQIQFVMTPDWSVLSMEGLGDLDEESGLVEAIAGEYRLDSSQTREDALGDFASAWREEIGYEVAHQIVSDLMDLFPADFHDVGNHGGDWGGLGVGVGRGPECVWMVGASKGNVVTVKTRAKLERPQAKKRSRWDPPFRYELSGVKKGVLEIDRTAGWILRGRIDEKYSGKKVVNIGATQGIKYPASFTRVIRYEPLR